MNMKIELLLKDYLSGCSNCYGIVTDTAAVVIDPGTFNLDIVNFLKQNSDKARLILITHAHYDHIGGAKRRRYSARPYPALMPTIQLKTKRNLR